MCAYNAEFVVYFSWLNTIMWQVHIVYSRLHNYSCYPILIYFFLCNYISHSNLSMQWNMGTSEMSHTLWTRPRFGIIIFFYIHNWILFWQLKASWHCKLFFTQINESPSAGLTRMLSLPGNHLNSSEWFTAIRSVFIIQSKRGIIDKEIVEVNTLSLYLIKMVFSTEYIYNIMFCAYSSFFHTYITTYRKL